MSCERCIIYPPVGSLDMLSKIESHVLQNSADSELYPLFRNCLLAVLNTGSQTDDPDEIFNKHKDFKANVFRTERGIKLELINPPQDVFVDGQLTEVIRRNLFAVLRDILFYKGVVDSFRKYQNGNGLSNSILLTDSVFFILRNAGVLQAAKDPNIVVCWGGHSINQVEYQYEREVGQELGVRGLDICTGCGPGAMEAPMRGAAVGHAHQAYRDSRFIGITETSIIAAEPPNPLVNELVIMPDIEKRLEAFVRLGHGIVIFPGGVGTAEEFLYILGILMMPENKNIHLPVILTGPKSSEEYFKTIDNFILKSLGEEAKQYYEIIIDDPKTVAQKMKLSMATVKKNRQERDDSYSFNWSLQISQDFQYPFEPTHENMAALDLHLDQPKEDLAASLRKAFSGIVAGNVKEFGVRAIKEHGPFQLQGDPELMSMVDELLQDFVDQQRMKLPGSDYVPCYEIKR